MERAVRRKVVRRNIKPAAQAVNSPVAQQITGTSGLRTIQASGTLEWYKTTEQTRYILNNAIAAYVHQRAAEKKKINANSAAIGQLTRKINEIVRITRDPENFQSIPRMQALIERYTI